MKKLLLLTIAFYFIVTLHAQSKRTEVKNSHDRYANIEVQYLTTTELPEGTVFKKGKVMLKKRYKTVYLDSNRIIIIQKPNGETTGAFKCRCESGSGSCGVSQEDGSLQCVALGGYNCTMDIIVKPGRNAVITQSNGNWRKLVIPSASIQRQKTEDPDQGGEIIKKKDLNVKQ